MSDEMMNFFVRDFVALFLCFLGFDEVKKKKNVWSFLQHMQHMHSNQNTNNILSNNTNNMRDEERIFRIRNAR